MTREIKLTHGYVTLVDDDDYEWLSRFNWHVEIMRGRPYARTSGGEASGMCMQRFIMGDPQGFEVDHRNNNSLDNRRGNLRLATASQNRANHKLYRNNSTGFHGVHRRKVNGSFMAYINCGGRRRYLGRFANAETAAKAHDEAAHEAFGEFAVLNFPPLEK